MAKKYFNVDLETSGAITGTTVTCTSIAAGTANLSNGKLDASSIDLTGVQTSTASGLLTASSIVALSQQGDVTISGGVVNTANINSPSNLTIVSTETPVLSNTHSGSRLLTMDNNGVLEGAFNNRLRLVVAGSSNVLSSVSGSLSTKTFSASVTIGSEGTGQNAGTYIAVPTLRKVSGDEIKSGGTVYVSSISPGSPGTIVFKCPIEMDGTDLGSYRVDYILYYISPFT